MTTNWVEYIGIAIDSIESRTQRILHIYCPELLPMVSDTYSRKEIESFNHTCEQEDLLVGDKVDTSVNLADTIIAEYLGGTNFEVPSIHEGEQVRLLTYAGMEKFYWLPLGRDDNLRRTELVRLRAANEEGSIKELHDDNTYFVELDTKYHKRVRISTSNSDGEDFRYLFEINPEKNTVTIQDDSGNHFFMDSSIPLLRLRNRMNTFIELDETDMNINVPRNLNFKVGGNITLDHAGHFIGQTGYPVDTDATMSVDNEGPINHKFCGPPVNTKYESGGNRGSNQQQRSEMFSRYGMTQVYIQAADEAERRLRQSGGQHVTSEARRLIFKEVGRPLNLSDKEVEMAVTASRHIAMALSGSTSVTDQPGHWSQWMAEWKHVLSRNVLTKYPSITPSVGNSYRHNVQPVPKGTWVKGVKPNPKVARSISSPYPGGTVTYLNTLWVNRTIGLTNNTIVGSLVPLIPSLIKGDQHTVIVSSNYTDIGIDNVTNIGNDNTTTIGNDNTTNVKNNDTWNIDNDRNVTIKNNDNLTIDSAYNIKVSSNYTIEASAYAINKGSVVFEKSIQVMDSIRFEGSISGPGGSWHNP